MPTSQMRPLLGPHTKLFTVRGATVDEETGVWTLQGAGAITLGLYINGFSHQIETDVERVEGYATGSMHEVRLVVGTTGQLEEIMRMGSPQSYLESFYYGDGVASATPCTHMHVVEQMAKVSGGATARQREFWCNIRNAGWGRARGKNVFVMELGPQDIDTANPLITVSV